MRLFWEVQPGLIVISVMKKITKPHYLLAGREVLKYFRKINRECIHTCIQAETSVTVDVGSISTVAGEVCHSLPPFHGQTYLNLFGFKMEVR